MKCDRLGLDLTLLDVNFVATEHNRNVFANADKIAFPILDSTLRVMNDQRLLTMPVGNVLVSDSRCDIEHDDATLAVDIITVSQPTKLLLTCCVPHIKYDISQVLSRSY